MQCQSVSKQHTPESARQFGEAERRASAERHWLGELSFLLQGPEPNLAKRQSEFPIALLARRGRVLPAGIGGKARYRALQRTPGELRA